MLVDLPEPRADWDDLDWLREQTSCRCSSRACSRPTTRGARATTASTASSSRTTAAGRSTRGRLARRARRGARRGRRRSPVLSTAASGAAPTSLKALALGADAVLLGRPYVYGLAVGGQDGVEEVIRQTMAETDLNARARSAARRRDEGRPDVDRGLILGERPASSRLEEIEVGDTGAGRGARPDARRAASATATCTCSSRTGRGRATRCCSGTRAPARSRRSATASTSRRVGERVVLGWRRRAATCGACPQGAPRRAAGAPGCGRPAGSLQRRALSQFLRTGTFADRAVVHAVAGGRGAARAAAGAGVPDRLRRRDRRRSRPRTARVWRGARGGRDRLRRRRALRRPGRASRAPPRSRSTSTSGSSSGRARRRDRRAMAAEGPSTTSSSTSSVAPATFGAGGLARRLRRPSVLVGLSPSGERAEIDLPLFEADDRQFYGGNHVADTGFLEAQRSGRWKRSSTWLR